MNKKLRQFLKKYLIPITPLKIKCIRVLLLNKDLKKLLRKIKVKGAVLDVGAQKAQYKKYVNCEKYLTLDLDKSHNPDICCDAHKITSKSNRFKMVIATEVLEHCYAPQKVVDEIYRVLKPGGICLISVPFMFEYHTAPGVKDYQRFTKDGLRYLFKEYSNVKIKNQGNRLQLIWENISGLNLVSKLLLNIFNPLIALIGTKKDSNCPLGYILLGKKPLEKK